MKLTLDRGDYFTLRIMLALFVLSPLVSPLRHVWRWAKGDPLIWYNGGSLGSQASVEAIPPLESVEGLIVRPDFQTLAWEFSEPTWAQRFGAMLPGLLVALVACWLCVIVWRFTRLVQHGRAFSSGVYRLFVQFGIALVALTFAFLGGEMAANMLIYAATPATGMGFALLSLDGSEFIPLLAAMVVLVIAYAWRIGEQLSEEAEATI